MTRRTLCRLPLLLLLFAPLLEAAAPDHQFTLVFDAGSTGTRVNVFEFRPDCNHTTGLRIVSLKEKKMVPGLFAFANAPERLRSELKPLMTFAAESVPKLFQASTPAVLRATAGLRDLTDVQRCGLLRVVAEVLGRSAFNVSMENNMAVSILSGKEEAEFGWVAVNFLKGALDKPGKDTYGMIDLGGGSAQIAFVPQVDAASDPNRVVFETARGQRYPLFARSYPNLGMSQAALEMLGYGQHNPPPPVYTSDCLNPRFSGRFSFGSVSIRVAGNNVTDIESRSIDCFVLGLQHLVRHDVQLLLPPAKVNMFVALGSFYYTAKNLQKLNFWNRRIPGSVRLADLYVASERVCLNPPMEGKFEPFLCLDAWYNLAVLSSVYQMMVSQSLDFASEINGYSVGWPLGFAINSLKAGVRRRCQ